jgi:hypothetical protein
MMADNSFDCVLVNFVTPFFMDTESIGHGDRPGQPEADQTHVCNLMTDRRQWAETEAILKAGGVPCFALPSDAARALAGPGALS